MAPQADSNTAPAGLNQSGAAPLSAEYAGREGRTISDFECEALPHMTDLLRAAASMLRNRAEAEDAVQEAYLQAWKCFDRFTPGTNCRAWLFRVLFHVISHQRRKWYSRFIPTDRAELEQTPLYQTPATEDLTDQEILGAFRDIPQQYAEVVMLADVQEFSYKEIQQTLGIPIGTVMSRLSRGRQLLRAQLASCAEQMGVTKRASGAS